MAGWREQLYDRAPGWLQTALLNAYAVQVERHRFGRPCREQLRWLRGRERLAPPEVAVWQEERLRRIVRLAYDRTRYYREAFDAAGIRPGDIRALDDLRHLPVTPKEAVKERPQDFLTAATPRRGWLHGHTSGTTGSPLSVWYDRETCIVTNAVDRQHKWWGGAEPGAWLGLLLGRTIVPPRRSAPPFWRANHVQRQLWLSSFHLRDEWLPLYAAEVRRRGIRFLEGYPSTLYILARHLLRSGERLPLAAAFSSSETLHHVQREAIEEAFQCRLFDYYGSAERVVYAAECEAHAGKHVAEEYGIVEIVDDRGAPVAEGERGYLVGTTLHNTAFPLLRYRVGDVSALLPDACVCGRTARRIADVTTKAEDLVVTPDGRLISPSVLTHPFKPIHNLRMSQLIQERIDLLRVKLVPGGAFGADDEVRLIAALRERVGAGMTIVVEVVEDIPREPSGKFRWVVSRVRPPDTPSWD